MGYIGNSPALNESVDTAQLASPLSGDLTVAGTLGTTGDTAAGDDAAVGYTAAEGLILTGQGSTDDVTIKNDADTTVLQVATGTTNVELTAGNLIIGTHGKGIDFSANTDDAGGMTAEILDDYEEGTWTILMKDGSANALSHDNDLGSYVKVGNLVHISVYTNINGLGSASGGVTIHGLPFTCGNGTQFYSNLTFCAGANLALPTAGDVPDAYVNANASTASCNLWTETTGAVALTAAHISDDGSFVISGAYHAA